MQSLEEVMNSVGKLSFVPARKAHKNWESHQAPVYADINAERMRAHNKHVGNGGSVEETHWVDPRWQAILLEEHGEVARVLCEKDLGNLSNEDYQKQLREELVQLAAMTCAWIAAIDAET